MLGLSSPEKQVKGRSWSWLSLSSHFLVGGWWVWSGDKLHYPGCAKYWLHGGAVRALQRLLPGWNLEHVHRHPQKKCPKPTNEHWGGPHWAVAPKMELSGWCYCRYNNYFLWCVCVYLNLPVVNEFWNKFRWVALTMSLFNRLAGGHVGSPGQLQHHSEGTEVPFQHVTRGRRHLGKKQQWPCHTHEIVILR